MRLSDFKYELPEELIARYPLKERNASRLLCVNANTNTLSHRYFTDIMSLIEPTDLLVCNNTRVIPARLFGNKDTGGKIEVLIERIVNPHTVLAHVRASKSPKIGSRIIFSDGTYFVMRGRQDDLFELTYEQDDQTMLEVIEALGEIPLPPYLHRQPEDSDESRYQTVYAEHKGSVAAPTAGLHFDEKILTALREKGVQIAYVTLHIGAGTFAPVRVDKIEDHLMHSEYLEVSAEVCDKIKETKARGGKVIAVGTTSVRSIESACQSGELKPFSGDTNIFIYPGYKFQCIDAMITNLHLPGSTLLMLVSAFGGYETMMHAYQEAIEQQYRFFSYGDAMFIDRR